MGGRKTFSPGDILQAGDVQDYLMDQSVMVFAGTAARSSAIASPTEGMFAYRTDADVLEFYNGSAWISASIASGAATVTNRNLLYNGATQVSQRGTSTTGITSGNTYYTADRWQLSVATQGTWTQDIQNDAPTGSGFRRSLRMLCTTADAAPAAGDLVLAAQLLEGQDLQRIRKGTSSAQKLTLSFWVKSNVTGTFITDLVDVDNNRSVSASYTISASATWEKKTITFPADTTGVLDNDNDLSLRVRWWLGAGSTYTSGTLQTTWGAVTAANLAVGQVNVAAATNNYWQVTGVQLEVGDVATDFEFKSYGQELRECQRYYQRFTGGSLYSNVANGWATATTQILVLVRHAGQMRVEPTAIDTSNVSCSDLVNADITPSAITINSDNSGMDATCVQMTVTGATQYRSYTIRNNNNVAAYLGLSAEL